MQNDYYLPPSDEIFDLIKQKSIEIWKNHDDTFRYATEKINRIKGIENINDNILFVIGMFDWCNQNRLLSSLQGTEAHSWLQAKLSTQ